MTDTNIDDIDYGLTVRDPWAQAIIFGPKRIENGGKRPPDKIVGERIAIHCGKTVDEGAIKEMYSHPSGDDLAYNDALCLALSDFRESLVERLGRNNSRGIHKIKHHPGHIIGTVRVVGWAEMTGESNAGHPLGTSKSVEGKHGWSDAFDDTDSALSAITSDPWWQGPVGWLLADPQPLDKPVPARGFPGVWDVERQIREAKS